MVQNNVEVAVPGFPDHYAAEHMIDSVLGFLLDHRDTVEIVIAHLVDRGVEHLKMKRRGTPARIVAPGRHPT